MQTEAESSTALRFFDTSRAGIQTSRQLYCSAWAFYSRSQIYIWALIMRSEECPLDRLRQGNHAEKCLGVELILARLIDYR